MKRLVATLGTAGLVGLAALPALAAEPGVAFRFTDERIIESSGLATSTRHEGIVYTHNDSDAEPLIFAVRTEGDTAGDTVATLRLADAPARDWEAISACERDGKHLLWVGDIGDNIDGWETYRLLRVAEPAKLADADLDWARYEMRYADGQARDAEALLCHPGTGRLYVVSKEAAGQAGIYRGPKRMRRGSVNVFTRVAPAPAEITDATFIGNGEFAVLRGYFDAGVFSPGWKPLARFTAPLQVQGESITETSDGRALLFGSEGGGSAVWRVPIPAEFADRSAVGGSGAEAKGESKEKGKQAAKKVKDAAAESADRAREVNDEGIPGVDGQMVALFSALGLGILILILATRRE